MFWSTGKKITSEVGLSSIVLQDGWRYRFSKKSISVGFFFGISVFLMVAKYLKSLQFTDVFLQFNGCPQSVVLFIELKHWSMHIVPCWNILLQVVTGCSNSRNPYTLKTSIFSPQNTINRMTTLSLYPNGPILKKCWLAPSSSNKYYLSALWSSCISRLQRILHSYSTCSSRGKR